MASSGYTYIAAVRQAEGIRQAAKSAAFTTWAYGQGAAFTTYVTALAAADNAFFAAVNAAALAGGPIGLPPNGQLGPGGAAPLPGTVPGNVGMTANSPSAMGSWNIGPTVLP
jgi:hypothetical protein